MSAKAVLQHYFLYLGVLAFVFACVVPSAMAYPSPEVWHVGYRFKGYEWDAPPLTSGEILAVKITNLPVGGFGAEFMAIILRYEPTTYYVACGWMKERTGLLTTRVYWFVEIVDDIGAERYILADVPKPEIGTWYRVDVLKVYSEDKYQTIIENVETLEQWSYFIEPVRPSSPRDHWAMIATTDDSIKIGTSHFRELKYRPTRGYTQYWYTHDPVADPPYVLEEISHHEFKAWRG